MARGYAYVSLTAAVADKASPLRQYFDERFPNRVTLQARYRASGGEILVPGGSSNPGTLGAAFDIMTRLTLDPKHVPTVALSGFIESPDDIAVIRRVVEAGVNYADWRHARAPEALMRASWALALCIEVYRLGTIPPGSPLSALVASARFTPEDLLRLAPPDALQQLSALHDVARERLYPQLPASPASVFLGPIFQGSFLCSADADAIVDGRLLEVKARLGSKLRSGGRSDGISLEDLYQLAGYALFDRLDEYSIESVALYSARFGTFFGLPLQAFLDEMAGEHVDIAEERARTWRLLGGADEDPPRRIMRLRER